MVRAAESAENRGDCLGGAEERGEGAVAAEGAGPRYSTMQDKTDGAANWTPRRLCQNISFVRAYNFYREHIARRRKEKHARRPTISVMETAAQGFTHSGRCVNAAQKSSRGNRGVPSNSSRINRGNTGQASARERAEEGKTRKNFTRGARAL